MGTTTEDVKFRHEMARGLVVLDADGNFDAETTADMVAWLIGSQPSMPLAR